jgi:hypothetical protein
VTSFATGAVEVDAQHLVLVADFGERQRQRAAGIAQMVLLADALGQVQVAQGGVGDPGIEHRGRQRLGAADDDAALGVDRGLAVDHVAVAHGQDRLAGFAARLRQREGLPVEQGDAVQVGVAFDRGLRHVARDAGKARRGTRP